MYEAKSLFSEIFRSGGWKVSDSLLTTCWIVPLFEQHLPCKPQWVLKDSHFWKAMGLSGHHHLCFHSFSLTPPPQRLPLPQPPLSHSVEWLTVHASSHTPKQGVTAIPIPNHIYLFSLIYLLIGTRTLREQIALSPRSLSCTLPFPPLNPPSAAGGGGRRWFHLSLLRVHERG